MARVRVGFLGKLIAAMTAVAAVVAVVTSLVIAAALVDTRVQSTRDTAELLGHSIYHQATRVIREHTRGELDAALGRDPALRSFADAVIGYSPVTVAIAIVRADGVAVFHSDPRLQGRSLEPTGNLDAFAALPPMTQFRRLWLDNDELSVDLPFSVDGSTPYGSVRVSVSSVLLWNALAETLARGVAVATGLVLAALLVASVAAGWLLAPVERLRRRLALIEVAEGEAPLELETTADADRIADFFSSISRSVAERDTEGDGDDWVGALLSGLDDGVIVIDGHGRIVSISRSAERLVSGDPDDEVRGRLLHDVLAKDHPLRELVATALLEGASGPQSVSFGYDGTTVECVVTAQTMHRSAGAPGVLVRARDALQMSRLISQLSYSQKLTSLGRLTAGVAHEIKNPLNAIAMQVELAKRRGERGGDGAGELVAPLEAIDTEVRRLDRVVQAFLQFTRPEEVRFEPVDLEGVIAQAASSISGQAAHHGVTVEVSVPEGLPRVQGSAELLRQALVNLMTNACDAMPDGGMLRVAAEHDADGRRVLLHVADTGVGIAEDERERIFELFYTTRRGGNGVGLSMVYRIAELHGGIVGVESAPGEGSRFTMTLPEGPV